MDLGNKIPYKVYQKFDVSNISGRLKTLNQSIWNLDVHRQAEGHGPHNKTNSIILNYCRGEPEFDKDEFPSNWNGDWGAIKDGKFWKTREYNDFINDIKNIRYHMVDGQLNYHTDIIVKELENQFNGIAGLVLYVKLPAGKKITPHFDSGYYLSVVHRLHIPIITNENVIFTIDGNDIHMEEGVLYELNNQLMHGVKNLGKEDRVHLIIDIIPKDKLPQDYETKIY